MCRTIHTQSKEAFEQEYLNQTEEGYYWTVKDATNMKQLLNKIKHKAKEKGKDLTDEEFVNTVIWLMRNCDDWTKENMSVALLNSRFNQIIVHGKRKDIGNKVRDLAGRF